MEKILKEEGCILEVEFKVDAENVKKETAAVLKNLQTKVQVSGFRKGKVPLDIVWEKFRPEIREKVIENILRRTIFDFISEKKINLAATPRIKEIKFEFDQPMSFVVEMEKHPQVVLKNYKGIKIKSRPTEVSEEELEREMKNWQERSARIVPSLSEVVQKEHYVLVNYEFSVNGQKSNVVRNQLIVVDNPENISGLKEGLLGMRRNEKRVIKINFPPDYPQKELAGKPAELTVELLDIKEKRVPAQDDDLAKECGFNSISEMREKLKEFLRYQKEHENKHYLEQQLFDEILRQNDFALPPSLVNEEKEALRHETERYFQQQKISPEILEREKDKLEKQISEEARRRVGLYYCLRAIADQENIQITAEDLEKEKEEIISRNKDKKEAAERYFGEHKDEIASHLLEEKVIKFLLDNAVIS